MGAHCADFQTTKTQRRGIESDNLGTGHIITNNDFTGNNLAGLIAIADAVTVQGNNGGVYNQSKMDAVPSASAVNNSFFTEGGVLKYKDANGAVKTVTLA